MFSRKLKLLFGFLWELCNIIARFQNVDNKLRNLAARMGEFNLGKCFMGINFDEIILHFAL